MSDSVQTEPEIRVGLSAWIIQDGNYGDFALGDRAKFALEFAPSGVLHRTDKDQLDARHLEAARHHVRARIVFVSSDCWVIDTGRFLAFQEIAPPEIAKVGAIVEGHVYVGIDPFFYFERLHTLFGMPALSYRWVVREIERETTPWVSDTFADGRKFLRRDETKTSFMPVAKTDAWHDDHGHGHYVLVCGRQGEAETP